MKKTLAGAVVCGLLAIGVAEAAGKKSLPERQKGSLEQAGRESALVKLGFDKRFFKVGDKWSVAWSFRKRTDHLKRAQTEAEMKRVVFTSPAVVNYEVREVRDQRLGKGKRKIARIHAKWAVEQLGQIHKEAILTVDQNLNPVARRVMTRGQRAFQRGDLDTRNSLRGIGLVPFYLPKLAREPGTAAKVPGVPREMSKFRPVEKAGTSALELDVKRGGRVKAQTFWVKGDLYAAAVSGPDVHGVLVKQSKAR